MSGGWLAPLIMFWLYVWGPLRPFHYPAGEVAPPGAALVAGLLVSAAPWWLPPSYYRIRAFERSGQFYEALGVRRFRSLVPDGDLANSWRRRRVSTFRIIANRSLAAAFVDRTERSERGHLVLLMVGAMSAAFAWHIGWPGWAGYLTAGNVVVNFYPILLQRYTRARLRRVLAG